MAFVTAGRHYGCSTIHIIHNVFRKSKLGRDVELQNTNNVSSESQVSSQWGFGLEKFEWYQDATSAPYNHFWIDLSLRTDDGFRYCTNTGSIPSKIISPKQLKLLKILRNDSTKILHSPNVPIVLPQVPKSFPPVRKKLSWFCASAL